MSKFSAAILGATGLVGQRLQQRLENHPLFNVVAISGSSSTSGTHYSDLEWHLEEERPLYNLNICKLHEIPDVDVVFSALPAEIALQIEPKLINRGIHVFSNASAFRMAAGIPLVIPEINPEKMSNFSGHACATNCTVVPIVMPLFGLKQFGIESVEVHTMQALSGAGWRLLFDEEALSGNVDPFIPGEEEKVISELKHLLEINCPITVICNRVPEKDGHIVTVNVSLSNPQNIETIKEAMLLNRLDLPSSPDQPVIIIDDKPNRDEHLWAGGNGLGSGMAIVVGGIAVKENVVSYHALSHNTIRGAAGGVVLLAEMAAQLGYISK
jgi:aspartate-semialdehyde dehydrogenase